MPKKQKIDGVIVGVHYLEDGQVDWVRAFLRRGAVYSDRIKLSRQDLISEVKAGKHFVTGNRQEYLASTFEVENELFLVQSDGNDILVTDQPNNSNHSFQMSRDLLVGVPIL